MSSRALATLAGLDIHQLSQWIYNGTYLGFDTPIAEQELLFRHLMCGEA